MRETSFASMLSLGRLDNFLWATPSSNSSKNTFMPNKDTSTKLLGSALIGFLCFSVISPWDAIFEGLFFLGVMPLVLYMLASRWIGVQSIYREIIWLCVFLLAFSGFSLFVGDLPFRKASEPARYTIELIFFLVALSICVPYWQNRARAYSSFLFLACFFACAFGISLYLHEGRFPGRIESEGVSFLKNPNLGSGALFGLWLAGFSLYSQEREPKKLCHLLEIATFFILVLYVVLAQSRGVALAVIAFLFQLFFSDLRKQAFIKIALLLFFAFVSLGFLYLYFDPVGGGSLIEGFSKRGLSYRLDIWLAVLQYPPENIFLGAGLGADFVNTPAGEYLKDKFGFPFKHTHNMLLGIYYSCGVLGISAFLVLACRVFFDVGKRVLSNQASPSLLIVMATVFILTSTNSYHFVDKPRPIWLMFWLPFVMSLILSKAMASRPSTEGPIVLSQRSGEVV